MTRSKDLFRKPYMETPEDDYSDMMKYIPDAAQPDYRSKPHSEMIKPYDDRIRDYGEMEHFYPSNFSIIAQPPSVDIGIVSGEPNPCEALRHIPFGAKQVWYEISCGGTLSINNSFEGGLPPYTTLGVAGEMEGDFTCDKNGNCYYHAPKECCDDSWDNILIQDTCGRTANIIIKTLAFDNVVSNYSTIIIGSDTPVDGDCYYLQTYVPNTIWTIDKGAINSSGCVSGLSGECGMATITATFMCLDNEIIATKQVRMPNGVWNLIEALSYSCSKESPYTPCTFEEIVNNLKIVYDNRCVTYPPPDPYQSNPCPEPYGCSVPGCNHYQALAGKSTYEWVCP